MVAGGGGSGQRTWVEQESGEENDRRWEKQNTVHVEAAQCGGSPEARSSAARRRRGGRLWEERWVERCAGGSREGKWEKP